MMDESVASDIAAVARIDSIPFILDLVCRNTGLRFAAVARVTETTWTACAVRDEIAFGLRPGGELDLKTTICDEIRDSQTGVIIDHVAVDPVFSNHHTPRHYGFQSYISLPIIRKDGSFFGTLCALDPEPARVSDPAIVSMFESFAQLIALQLDAQDQIARGAAALSEAERVGEFRERFIAILGHDLRNPLASIEAGARLLAKTDLPPRESTIVQRMLESCGRMSGLIRDVLDFARGRLGEGMILSPSSDQDLKLALGQIVEELRIVHPARAVSASIAVEGSVDCDVPRITQLLSNLLGNALAHGDPAKPVLVEAGVDGGDFVIEVANGGEPISPERIDTLFEPFTESHDGGPRQGLGLGLFIVGEIARAHGGQATVTSTADETRFRVTLPRTRTPAA